MFRETLIHGELYFKLSPTRLKWNALCILCFMAIKHCGTYAKIIAIVVSYLIRIKFIL